MKRIIIVLILISGFGLSMVAQKTSAVKWYTFEEADQLLDKDPRPVFVDAYTDWCGWCKRLDRDTFSNPVIAELLNEKFYPVKFNAESKSPLTFRGKEYINDGKYGKTHQMTLHLLRVTQGYPTVVFLNNKGDLLQPIPGYKTPADLEPILIYFAEEKYNSIAWADYLKTFESKLK